MLQRYLAQAMQAMAKPPDPNEALRSGLLSAGLGMMAGSRGRSFGEALGQGGLLGLQAYGETKAAQQKDPAKMIALATAMQGMQDRRLNQQSLANFRTATGPQPVPAQYVPQSDVGPGDYTGPVTPPMTPQMVAPATTAPANLTRDVMQRFLLDQSPQVQAMAKNWLEQQDKGARKLKDTKTLVRDGQRVTVNIFDDGTTEVVPFAPEKEKPITMGMGSKTALLNPDTYEPMKTFIHDATPGEVMTDARTRERMAQDAQQFAASQAQSAQQHRESLNKPQILDTGNGFVAATATTGETRPLTGAGGVPLEKVKDLPSQFVAAQVTNSQLSNKLNIAEKLLKGEKVGDIQGDPKAMIPIAGRLPGMGDAIDILDKGGVATRAAVADIGSQIILNRSGAAVTLQEFERSRPFIPKPTDAPDVVKTKIAYLKKIVQEENDALNETAKRMGYRVPQQASRAPTLDDVANEILRRRPGGQ
jgi:LysM repeat protein